MELTNKTNGSYFWRESGNRLFVEIDGQPYELKYTVAQNEAYQNLIDELQTAANKTENTGDQVKVDQAALIKMAVNSGIESALPILEIAFNPKREEKKFDKDALKDMFSENLDLVQIVAHTWVDKKLLNPSLSVLLDPQLAPAGRGAR
jgi:hypothetical protein